MVMDFPRPGSHARHSCHSSFQKHISICEKCGRTLRPPVPEKAGTQNSATLIKYLPRCCVACASRNEELPVLQKRCRVHRTRNRQISSQQAGPVVIVLFECPAGTRST